MLIYRSGVTKSVIAILLISVLEGKDLYARLTKPRGQVISSSIVLEKTKLEEEVKQLHSKISELDK